MKTALENESNPLDADLEKVLPGIHQWHQANESKLWGVKSRLDEVIDTVKQGFDGMVDVASETRAESDKCLAGVFLSIAAKLL